MARSGRSRVGWLQRLFARGGEAEALPASDALRCLLVEEAVSALELRACDVRVRRLDAAASAAQAAHLEVAEPPLRNAFGHVPQELAAASASEALRLATGTTLAGLRTSLTLCGHELIDAHAELSAAAERLLPLVVQVTNGESGHAGLHAVAESGCFALLAEDGQDALDWTLLARWLAERALWPGLVAHDGPSLDSFVPPGDDVLTSAIGAPEAPIACPTEAQRLLFGEERPRLLPWFDAERPVATAGPRGAQDRPSLEEGRRLLFQQSLRDLAQEGMQRISRVTGRPLAFVREHAMSDAQVVVIAQGRVAGVARAVADALRRQGGVKVGVLAPSWLRPFPAVEIAQRSKGRQPIAVIETLAPGADTGPVWAEVVRARSDARGLVSVSCSGLGPDPAALAGLCERLARGGELPATLRLERLAVSVDTGFPRRDALLQASAHAYPALAERTPLGESARAVCASDPPGLRSLALLADASELPPDLVARTTSLLREVAGPVLRGSLREPWPGLCEARMRAAPQPFADPGPRAPVSLLVALGRAARRHDSALSALQPGGRILLASDATDEEIVASLPPAWHRSLREHDLHLLRIPADPVAALESLRLCLSGVGFAEDANAPREIEWAKLPAAGGPPPSRSSLVSGIRRARPAHDSLPRFYGELLQPMQAGAAEAGDPLSVVGAVPGYASALSVEPVAAPLPELSAALCTGCGRCWSACPDSAIGVALLPPESLLTSASRLAGCEGRVADAVRRAHKHLATRLAADLVRESGGVLDARACRDAFGALAGRLSIAEDELAEHEQVVAATGEAVESLRPMATASLFVEREQRSKGSGGLLALAFDPRACVGCGLCAAVCPESAISVRERDAAHRRQEAKRFADWEALPDTPGELLASVAREEVPGALAGLLLSRHAASAQVGSGEGEPGSGERLALRWVSAFAEAHGQRRVAALVQSIATARSALEARARGRLGEGIARAEVHTLKEALEGGGERPDLARVGERLEALGSRADVDRPALLRMLRLAEALQAREQALAHGADGLGRARFGVVVAGERLAATLARFPLHPYHAPLTATTPEAAADLARGAAAGLVAAHVAGVRELRAAAVEQEAPPDRSERLEAIAALGWSDLGDDERGACPPLLLLLDDQAWIDHGIEPLARVFASDLPIKLILLDGRGRLDPVPEPLLLALVQRRAFVLSTSLAHPDHLAAGVADALAFAGPALVQIHTPSPARHGFASDATLEIARLAVESRAHCLLRYDPRAEGSFGQRIDLSGNPNPEADAGEIDFAAWASRQARFAGHFAGAEGEAADARIAAAAAAHLEVWRTLQELAGLRSPFVARLRGELTAELEAGFEQRTRALETAHRAALAQARAAVEEELIERVAARLQLLSATGAGGLGAAAGTESRESEA